jgi:centrosomal protein CEP104
MIASDMGVDLITAQRISELQGQKLSAIQREDYDDAKRLKAAVDRLKAQGIRIAALEGRKQSAVNVEDYDLAKQLKIEIERLRAGGNRPSTACDGPPSLQMTPPSSTHDIATDGNDCEAARAVGGGGRRMASTPPRAPVFQRGPITTDTSSTPMSNIMNGNITTPAGAGRGSSTSWNAYEERPAVARGSYNIEITEQEAAATMGATSPLSALAAPAPGDGNNNNKKSSRALGSPVIIQHQPSSTSSLPQNQATPTVGFINKTAAAAAAAAAAADDDDSLGPIPVGFPSDLPPPSPPIAGDMKNIEMLAPIAGEYVSRAAFSKNWQLREAALNKISTDIKNNNNNSDSGGVFRMLCKAVLTKALRDRVATVVTSALELIKTAVQHTSGRDVAAGVGDILPLLIERACDTNSRVKECAVDTIIYLVKVPDTGLSQSHATAAFLKSPPAHLKNIGGSSPKVVAARVSLITRLLPIIGVANNSSSSGSGFEVEGVMDYARGPLTHGNADVRYAAVSLVVELGRQNGGLGMLQLLPADLNPKLKESIEKELSVAATTRGSNKTAATAGAITSSKPRTNTAATTHDNSSSKKAPPRQYRQSPSMSSPPPPKSSPGGAPAITIPAYRPPTTTTSSSNSPPSLPLPSPALAATSNPQLFEEELAAREDSLGPWHPSVAEALANLAIVRSQQGQTEEALPLYQRALAVWEKVEGEQSVNVAHTLTDMAVIHLEGGRDAAGRPLLERALKIQEGLCGPDHPDVVAIRDVLEEQWGWR